MSHFYPIGPMQQVEVIFLSENAKNAQHFPRSLRIKNSPFFPRLPLVPWDFNVAPEPKTKIPSSSLQKTERVHSSISERKK